MEIKLFDKFKTRVCLGMLTQNPIADPSAGRALMDMIISMLPECAPVKYGNFEPIKRPFTDVEEAIIFWRSPFLWACKKSRCSGSVWMNNSPQHTGIYLTIYGKDVPYSKLLDFLKSASLLFDVDFGYLHVLTGAEANSHLTCYAEWHPFDVGITTRDLRMGIPNLPCVSIFGKSYVQLLGKFKLLTSPAQSISVLSEDIVFLQIADLKSNLIADYSTFEENRTLVKRHLGEEFFLDASTSCGRKTPHF